MSLYSRKVNDPLNCIVLKYSLAIGKKLIKSCFHSSPYFCSFLLSKLFIKSEYNLLFPLVCSLISDFCCSYLKSFISIFLVFVKLCTTGTRTVDEQSIKTIQLHKNILLFCIPFFRIIQSTSFSPFNDYFINSKLICMRII